MIQGKGRIRTDIFGLGQSMLKLVTEVMYEKLLCTVVLRRKACRADLRITIVIFNKQKCFNFRFPIIAITQKPNDKRYHTDVG